MANQAEKKLKKQYSEGIRYYQYGIAAVSVNIDA